MMEQATTGQVEVAMAPVVVAWAMDKMAVGEVVRAREEEATEEEEELLLVFCENNKHHL